MNYRVVVHQRAVRHLNRLPKAQKQRIKQSLRELEDGISDRADVKAMLGEWKGYYRMRIGDIRIIFWLDNKLRLFMLII